MKTITCKFFLSAPCLESSPEPESLSFSKIPLNVPFCCHFLSSHPLQHGEEVILKGSTDTRKINLILHSAGWSALFLRAFYSPYKRFSTQTSVPHPFRNVQGSSGKRSLPNVPDQIAGDTGHPVPLTSPHPAMDRFTLTGHPRGKQKHFSTDSHRFSRRKKGNSLCGRWFGGGITRRDALIFRYRRYN